MSAVMEQHERWQAARARLMAGRPVPEPKPRRFLFHPDLLPKRPKPVKLPYILDRGDEGEFIPQFLPARDVRVFGRDIIKEVARKHGLPVNLLISARRAKEVCAARHEAVWRMANETSLSLPQIGRLLGDRDHTTIINSLRRHQERIDRGEA